MATELRGSRCTHVVHCTVYSVHYVACWYRFSVYRYTVLCVLCSLLVQVLGVPSTLYSVHCVACSYRFSVYTVHCTVCTV